MRHVRTRAGSGGALQRAGADRRVQRQDEPVGRRRGHGFSASRTPRRLITAITMIAAIESYVDAVLRERDVAADVMAKSPLATETATVNT